jgi:hypothetical protein
MKVQCDGLCITRLKNQFGRPVFITLTPWQLNFDGHGKDGRVRRLAVGSGWCAAKVADRLIGKLVERLTAIIAAT